jgi:hypothetical protein
LDVRLCPVRALLTHFGLSKLDSARPLFNFVNGSMEMLFTHAGFVSLLKTVLTRLGVDSQLYSAHSLRRGGASFAFSAGLSPLQIKSRGDWASSAFERYVFIAPEGALSAAGTLAFAASH